MTNSLPDAKLFRAYDIRGCAETLLTPAAARSIAGAFARRVADTSERRIVLGRDGRLTSPTLHAVVRDTLVEAGLQVLDIGLVPTPVLYFAQQHLRCKNGLMITGSHNPAGDNGFKLCLDGEPFFGDALRAMRDEITAHPPKAPGGAITEHNLSTAYIDAVAKNIRLQRPLAIAIDCGNGAAGTVAGALYRALGCEVTELYSEVDGHFPNHHPDPAVASNMAVLGETVTANGLDLGLAFDGDGDRIGFLDEGGTRVTADRQLMLFADHVLAHHPGAPVVFDVKCSRRLPAVVRAAGGVPVFCRTGHANLKRCVHTHNAPLAGELSGHTVFADRWFAFDDALYAGARLIELAAAIPEPASTLFAPYPQDPSTDELLLPVDGANPHRITDDLIAASAFDDAEVFTLDGLRIEFPDGWGLVRASNTTSSLVLRFEGDTHATLHRIRDRILSELRGVAPDLPIPDHIINADATQAIED